jgi:TonB family protein
LQNEPKRIASAGAFGSFDSREVAPALRQTVVSGAGFGTASADNPAPARTQPKTECAGFGDTIIGHDAARSNRAMIPQPSEFTPVEITYKPRPAYTDEARRLQIEGEVVIEAVFTASSAVEIVRIIRGLGHGLDESAIAAVRSIRFNPAKQRGRPADSTATVRMRFELAY